MGLLEMRRLSSNRQFGEITGKVVIYGKTAEANTVTFFFPECKYSYRIIKDKSEDVTKASVDINGISLDTYGKLRKSYDGARVEIYDGIDGNNQLTFSGKIDEVKYGFDKGAQKLLLVIDEDKTKAHYVTKTITIEPSNLNAALQSICSEYGYKLVTPTGDNLAGIQVGKFCSTGNCHDAIRSILPPRYSYTINETEIIIYQPKTTSQGKIEVKLTLESGLLEYPTKNKDKSQDETEIVYAIATILIPGIKEGSVLSVPTGEYWYSGVETGKWARFNVLRYEIEFNDGAHRCNYECSGVDGLIDD